MRKQGSIIKQGPKKYRVRKFIGRKNGKRQYVSKTIFGSRQDALKALAALEPTAPSVSLKAWLERWINEGTAAGRITAHTADSYRGLVRRYLPPELCRSNLEALTPAALQALVTGLSSRVSPRTVQYTLAMLGAALQRAHRLRLMATNPMELVDRPGMSRRGKGRALTRDEVARLLAAASPAWHPLWLFLITMGTRPSEACALTWDDIRDGKVSITKKVVWRKNKPRIERPKTEASIRVLPLPDVTARALMPRFLLVFPNTRGGYLEIRNIRRAWKRTLRIAGLDPTIRLYDARHTCFSLLLEAGVHPKVVQERAGHASFALTMDTYSHVIPGLQAQASAVFDQYLARGDAV